MRSLWSRLKGVLVTVVSLLFAFVFSLLFQYIFDVQEHITTIFVFAVFLISLLTDGYFYGVLVIFVVIGIIILATKLVNYLFSE